MTTVAERTKLLIDSQGMNEYSFSKRIGKSNTAITKLVKGESKPGYDMLESIFQEFPNLNREWYLEGTDSMWKDNQKSTDNGAFGKQVAEKLFEEFTKLREQLSVKDKQLEAAGRTVEGLQRTVDALLGQSNKERSFRKPVSTTGRVIELYPRKVA